MAQRQRRKRRQGAALVLSGASWVSQFPTSKDVEDLASPFKDDLKEFLAALSAAGATVEISATYRPKERAFLMHYAFAIARKGLNPRTGESIKVKAGKTVRFKASPTLKKAV